jgi:hypothetical protein
MGSLVLGRDLLVGSNDVANGQEFHAEENNFALLGPTGKNIFSLLEVESISFVYRECHFNVRMFVQCG